jgi:hypothetical protein
LIAGELTAVETPLQDDGTNSWADKGEFSASVTPHEFAETVVWSMPNCAIWQCLLELVHAVFGDRGTDEQQHFQTDKFFSDAQFLHPACLCRASGYNRDSNCAANGSSSATTTARITIRIQNSFVRSVNGRSPLPNSRATNAS